MSRTRTIIIALALAAVLPAGLAHLTGCEKSPEEPVFENPFDPDGPSSGDALQIAANTFENDISVKWTHYRGRNIAMYAVDHRTDLDTEWTALYDTLIDDDDVSSIYYLHEGPAPNRTHYYMVQAITADGEFSLTGYTTPGALTMPPVVVPDANPQELPSRYLGLKIVVEQGDSLRVADNPDFTDAVLLPAAAPGDTATLTWDFGPHAAGDSLGVHVQSFTSGSYASVVYSRSIEVVFEPEFEVVGASGNKVPAVVNDLRVENRGVVQMRFANTEEDLPLATWVPGDSIYEDFALEPITAVQHIWGEFESDFGFNYTDDISVVADRLKNVTFKLDLPNNRVISRTRVGIECSAAATEMRFSQDGDFTTDPDWRPFTESDSVDFVADEAGPVIIFAQVRNDWDTRTDLSDSLYFVLMPLSVYFVTPSEYATIEGGTTYVVTGRSLVADGGSLMSHEVDLGDGIWRTQPSTNAEWSLDWDVPEVTENTSVILRARATSLTETVTTSVSVTVIPPADE